MAGIRHHVRIQDQGRVTLSADLRDKHNLQVGDLVTVEDSEAGVLIRPQDPAEAWMPEYVPLVIPEPTAEELARRRELGARILENRKHRVITPLTTADLVHMSRDDETWYGPDR